jgi:hypothetical protein
MRPSPDRVPCASAHSRSTTTSTPGYGNRDMTLREPYYAALVIGYHSQTGELRPLKSLALKVRLAVKRPRKQSLIEYLVPC